MYARVNIGAVKPEKVDDFIKWTKENLVPSIKKHKGFKGYYGMGDYKTGKGLIISLWDTEANMMDYESSIPKENPATSQFSTGQAGMLEHYVVSVKA